MNRIHPMNLLFEFRNRFRKPSQQCGLFRELNQRESV